MTTLQEMGEWSLTLDSFVPIMLKSTDRWDQVAAFVTMTMRHKMEIAQKQPIATVTQHPMPDLIIPRHMFAICNPATEEEDDPGWSQSETFTCSQDTS